jgi:hypothetical protein
LAYSEKEKIIIRYIFDTTLCEITAIRRGNREEEAMSSVYDEYDKIRGSDDLIDPDLEDEYEVAQREYGETEKKPRLTLVKPAEQKTEPDSQDTYQLTEIDLPVEDPPGWPDF